MNATMARKVIDMIHLPAEIGINEIDDDFDKGYDELYNAIAEAQMKLGLGSFSIENGATKAVIIFDDMDCVIKIPFTGMWYYQTDDDGEYIDDVDPIFEYFEGPRQYDCTDYCEIEYNFADEIAGAGFGSIVADTEYYNGIVIQEKVIPLSTHQKSKIVPSENSLARVKSMNDRYKMMTDTWTAVVFDTYGEVFWRRFVDWNREEDSRYDVFSDMYSGNYGYRVDGTPVMFDISGFEEDF